MKLWHTVGSVCVLFTCLVWASCSSDTGDGGDDGNAEEVQFLRRISVTPDDTYSGGGFCRINYIPSTDRFAVTFGDKLGSGHPGRYAYKEYFTDLSHTGNHGVFHNGGGDTASVVVGDYYFFLSGSPVGWKLSKYDPAWNLVGQIDIELFEPREKSNDQMLAYANGQLVASSLYDLEDQPNDPHTGEATHHRYMSPELDVLGRRVLEDVPHVNGSYLLFEDGIYHFVTSTAFFGDLIVLQYDQSWDLLEHKTLVEDAQWPQGAVRVGDRYFVSYLDVSQQGRTDVMLGIFDENWSTISVHEVSDIGDEPMRGGRPSVIEHGGRLYVSYDVSTFDPDTSETNQDWQCRVAEYRIG